MGKSSDNSFMRTILLILVCSPMLAGAGCGYLAWYLQLSVMEMWSMFYCIFIVIWLIGLLAIMIRGSEYL